MADATKTACARPNLCTCELSQDRNEAAIGANFAAPQCDAFQLPLGQLIGVGNQSSGINPLPSDLEGPRPAMGYDVQCIHWISLLTPCHQLFGDRLQGIGEKPQADLFMQGTRQQLADPGAKAIGNDQTKDAAIGPGLRLLRAVNG